MTHAKSEKARIVVAFGDFGGYSSFYEASINDEKELNSFMDTCDDIVDGEAERTGYRFDDTGDGFMCTVDLVDGHNCHIAIKVFKKLWKIHRRIESVIRKKKHPRPDGYRIRIACGQVTRKVKRDGRIVYRGSHINWCSKLLLCFKPIGFIVHESIKQLISRKQAAINDIHFRKLPLPNPIPDGLPKKEAAALWEMQIRRKKNARKN